MRESLSEAKGIGKHRVSSLNPVTASVAPCRASVLVNCRGFTEASPMIHMLYIRCRSINNNTWQHIMYSLTYVCTRVVAPPHTRSSMLPGSSKTTATATNMVETGGTQSMGRAEIRRGTPTPKRAKVEGEF